MLRKKAIKANPTIVNGANKNAKPVPGRPAEKRWRTQPKSKEKVAFNPNVQRALKVVKWHDEQKIHWIKVKNSSTHKKPACSNYRTVQRALKNDPDALVDYQLRRRYLNCGGLTRLEQAKHARRVRIKRRLLKEHRMALERRRERKGVPGEFWKIDPEIAAEIKEERRRKREKGQQQQAAEEALARRKAQSLFAFCYHR